ncbi:MAG TPA: phosphatidylglycerol lysyltransferase domain-containing protein [Candidatus Saccharimonadales bacterium]
MLKFKTLEFSDINTITNFVRDLEFYSDFNFLSLFSWSLHSQTSFAIDEDCIYISMPDYITQGLTYCFFPKSNHVNALLKFCDWLKNESIPTKFELIPEEVKDKLLESHIPDYIKLTIDEDRDSFDYVLDPGKISKSIGSEYSDFRYKIKNFNKIYGARIRLHSLDPNSQNDIFSCIDLARKWADRGIENIYYEDEIDAFSRFLYAIKNTRDLVTITIYDGDKLIAFVACEILNKERAIGHFLKYDREYKNIYYFMVYKMCEVLHAQDIKELNIEQDMGLIGLRQAKEHLRPARFLKKYSLVVLEQN